MSGPTVHSTVTPTVTTASGLSDSISETLVALAVPFGLDPIAALHLPRHPRSGHLRVPRRPPLERRRGRPAAPLPQSFEVDRPDNDGAHRDQFRTTSTSFEWRMWELELDFCSNTVVLGVGPDGAIGDLANVRAVINGREVIQTLRIEDGSEG